MKKLFSFICLLGVSVFPMWVQAALPKPSITSIEVNMTEAYYIASSAKPRCQCYLTLTAPVDGALGYEVKTQTGVIRFHDSAQTRFAINAIVPYPNTTYNVQIRALGATESDASAWSDVYALTSGPKIGPDVDTWFGTTETTAAGTTYYYYGIAVASQLDQIASSISDTATPLLVADIDMGGRQLTKAYMTTRQSGTLGMGFMVDNFTINTEGTAGQAAFIGAQIRGVKTYGMIIGPRARIKGGFGQTGGLIAYSYGRVEASMNYAKVTGSPFVTSADNGGMGGIAAVGLFRAGANINFGQIECYGDNAGTWDETLVRAAHTRYTPAGVGGIAGNNPISVFISNMNMGRIDGRLAKGPVGGIVGDNRYAPSPTSTQNSIPNLIANLNAGEICSVAGQSNVGLIGGLSSSCAVKYNLTTGNASSLPFSTGGELYGNQIKSLTEINTSTFCPSFPNVTTVSSGWRSDDAWVTGTAFGYSSSTAYPKPVALFRTRPDIVRALDASMDIIPVNANVAGAVTLDVLANDRDPENKSTFKIVSVTQPNKYGSVEIINDGQAVRYTPNIPQDVKGKFIYAYFDYVIEETSPNGQFQGIPYTRKQDARVFLTIRPENDAPAFSPAPLTLNNQSAGYVLDYDLSTHVTDEYPCTYALIGTSDWASLSASGKLTGVPPLEKSGTTETLNVRITDVMGVETNVVVTIPLVRGENVPPVASVATFQLPGAVSDANDGRYATQVANSVNLSSKFSDADGHTLTYSVRNAPSWCSINASTGVLSFTAPQSRDAEKAYEIQVVATDTYSMSAELTVQFSIVYNEAPVWSTKSPEMYGGKPYFLFPTAFNSITYAVVPYRVPLLDICQDPEGDALKFRAEGQTIYWGFPAYDTRSARTESYATWWTAFHVWQGENIDGIVSSQRDVPRGNLEGRWTVRAYDKWGTYADCTINIPVASPGEVTNYAPVFLLKEYSFDAFVNQPYSQSVALAYDFAASTVRIPQPLTYSSSDAPAWLTVAADGTITGTPPAAGTYTFTLKAQDPGIGNKQDDAAPLSATTKIVISVQNQVIDMTGMLGEDLWNYYTFDTDKAAHATLGSDHTSLATGDTTAYTASAGKFGNALVGAGGFKTATGSYSLYQPNATNFTFSAWFKRGAAVTVSTPLIARGARVGTSGNDYTHNSGWSLFRTASGEVVLRVRDKNKTVDLSVTSRDTPFASNFGNYVHVAWTREGDVATLYVNGVAQGTITGLAGKDIAVVTDQWWREFMAGTDSAAQPSAAMASGDGIDDMAMWKRALAANEVAMIASSQVPLANIANETPPQAASDYDLIRQRFSELALPETQPTTYEVFEEADLAVTVASAVDGSLIILRNDVAGAVWNVSAMLLLTKNVTIVGMNSAHGFTYPVTLSGNNTRPVVGINAAGKTVRLANIVIANGKSLDMTYGGGGLSLVDGSLIASSLSFTGNSASYAANVFVNGGAATFYNSTFQWSGTAQNGSNNSIVRRMGGTIRLVYCTILGTIFEYVANTITQENCLTTVAEATAVATGRYGAHYVPQATSAAIDAGLTSVSGVTYDALGHLRSSGVRPDLGAVEAYELIEDLPVVTAFASGCREVYIGWPKQSLEATVQYSVNQGQTWSTIPDVDLRRHVTRYNADGDPVDYNWTCVRHINRSAGWRARYRVAFGSNAQVTAATADVTVNASTVPQLATNPGAKRTIFLSFDGYVDDSPEFIQDYRRARRNDSTLLNADATYLKTEPYWYGTGSATETAAAVEKIWKMVAEDYLPFDVNVTTIDPGYDALVKSDDADDVHGIRVVIGTVLDTRDNTYVGWFDRGGVSMRNAFNYSYPVPAYSIVNNFINYAATTASHEIGHTLGLDHDSGDIWRKDGTTDRPWTMYSAMEYYFGPSISLTGNADEDYTSDVQWIPIMGGPVYFDNNNFINQWCKGGYYSFTQSADLPEKEDDVAIIIGLWNGRPSTLASVTGMEYRYLDYGIRLKEDDHGDSADTATVLNGPGSVSGLIGKNLSVNGTTTNLVNDVDCFKIYAKAGALTATIDIPIEYGSNLDAKIDLHHASGARIASADLPTGLSTTKTRERFRSAHLAAEIPSDGVYTLTVTGTGRRVGPPVAGTSYRDDKEDVTRIVTAELAAGSQIPTDGYGSMGEYTLVTTYTADTVPETPSAPTMPYAAVASTAAWTALPWQGANGASVPASAWASTISAATVNTLADATVTLDRSVTLGTLTLAGTGALTINANTTETLTATTIDASAAAQSVFAIGTGSAAVKAGAETVLTQSGSGALTIAAGKTAVLRGTTWAGTIANSGTLAVEGSSGYTIAGANAATGALFVREHATLDINATGGNKKYIVNGAGAAVSTLILSSGANWGMTDGSSISNVLVRVTDKEFWWERSNAMNATDDLELTQKLHLGNPGTVFTIGALSGSADIVNNGVSPTLHVTMDRQATTYSGVFACAMTVSGSNMLTLTGNFTGAVTVNAGASLAYAATHAARVTAQAGSSLRVTLTPAQAASDGLVTLATVAAGSNVNDFAITLVDATGANITGFIYSITGTSLVATKHADIPISPFSATVTGTQAWSALAWQGANGVAVSSTFDWSTATVTNVSLTASGTACVQANVPITVKNITVSGSALTIASPVTMTGGLTLRANTKVTFSPGASQVQTLKAVSPANATSTLAVTNGTLVIPATATSDSGNGVLKATKLIVEDGGLVRFEKGDASGYSITGNPMIVRTGGTLFIAKRDTLRRGLQLEGGRLVVSGDDSGRALDLFNGVTLSVTENSRIEGAAVAGTDNPLIYLRDSNPTFTVAAGKTLTCAVTFATGNGKGFIKNGAGTMVQNGLGSFPQTYTGATSIQAGTYELNTTHNNGAGAYTVANGATLRGTGQIAGTGGVTIQSGATLVSGLTMNTLTLAQGSTLVAQSNRVTTVVGTLTAQGVTVDVSAFGDSTNRFAVLTAPGITTNGFTVATPFKLSVEGNTLYVQWMLTFQAPDATEVSLEEPVRHYLTEKFHAAREDAPTLPTVVRLQAVTQDGAVVHTGSLAAEVTQMLELTPEFTADGDTTRATVAYEFRCDDFQLTTGGVKLSARLDSAHKQHGAINGRLVIQKCLPNGAWEDVPDSAQSGPTFTREGTSGAWRFAHDYLLTLPEHNCMFRVIIKP